MLAGLISDTHGLLRPEALDALRGSDAVLHAGDIGDPSILDRLAEIAPVIAVRGNNDRGPWAEAVPEVQRLELCGVSIVMIHDRKQLAEMPASGVVIAGHSHQPKIDKIGDVLFINPGSAGPRRFKLPITVAMLRIIRGSPDAEIVTL